MQIILNLIVFIFGLVIGSFIAALTYRLPRNISIAKGRSFCPKCNKQIAWYDNIPLFSYLFLHGKCRNCGNEISPRYFFIEITTALLFVLVSVFVNGCRLSSLSHPLLCSIYDAVGFWSIPYLLFVVALLVIIFIIDFENQLIFDEYVFLSFILIFIITILFFPGELYERLFAGFAAGNFLLILNLISAGRGMGLGDAKLSLFAGLFFGIRYTVVWLFGGFLLGAVVGTFLLSLGKAHLGRPIPFGPFLVVSFFLTLLWGEYLIKLFLPFL